MSAIAGMAPRADGQALRKRVLSAAILLPLAAVDVWLGAPYWGALVCVFAMVMAWEWARMCAAGRQPPRGSLLHVPPEGLLSILAVALGISAAAAELYASSLLFLVLGALGSALLGLQGRGPRGAWQGFGTLYIGLPGVAIVWIRSQPDHGLAMVVWILALVVAVDTGAFAAGRLVGGPKLAPGISPNKTWAGLLGGIAAAAVIGGIVALWLGLSPAWRLVLASGVLAVVEQLGDLVESGFKRHFGVKDSSGLIPGHGGFLDRTDGLLAVSLAVALAELLGGGILAWTR